MSIGSPIRGQREPLSHASISLKTASASVSSHENALIVPFRRGAREGQNWHAGVFDQNGAAIQTADMATLSHKAVPTSEVFHAAKLSVDDLDGPWLFSGIVSKQIGHIITRGMGRLWATDHIPDDVGLVFASLHYGQKEHAFVQNMLRCMGLTGKVKIVSTPTRVASLYSAPDLFSEASECTANADYAKWMRKKAVPKPGNTQKKKLYLTRGSLPRTVGRFLNEEILETNLESSGFEVVAPETLSLEAQFKLYSEADTVIAAEGSALHILPFALRDTAKLFVIQRRQEMPILLTNQIKSFSKAKVRYIDAIQRVYWPEERADNLALVSLDFEKIRDALVSAKAVNPSVPWRIPSEKAAMLSLHSGRPDGARFLTDEERLSFLRNLRRQRRVRRLKRAGAA
jgi:capsular polysaccharide biosynthesis protein